MSRIGLAQGPAAERHRGGWGARLEQGVLAVAFVVLAVFLIVRTNGLWLRAGADVIALYLLVIGGWLLRDVLLGVPASVPAAVQGEGQGERVDVADLHAHAVSETFPEAA